MFMLVSASLLVAASPAASVYMDAKIRNGPCFRTSIHVTAAFCPNGHLTLYLSTRSLLRQYQLNHITTVLALASDSCEYVC